MNIRYRVLLILCVLFVAATSSAEEHTAEVSRIHFNPALVDRGVCVMTVPTLSTDWACLYNPSGHLYKEMTSMLLSAYAARSTCRFVWTEMDDAGFAKIRMLECR